MVVVEYVVSLATVESMKNLLQLKPRSESVVLPV
jgi:hypothetical protein